MSDKINYYEILAKLREFEYKLIATNSQKTSCWDIDILLLQIKAFIFGNDILKTEFKKRQQAFYKDTTKETYKTQCQDVYNKIKEIAINNATKKQRTLTYFEAYSAERYFAPHNAEVKQGKDYRCFIDEPRLYYYPSLQADRIELSGIFPGENEGNSLRIHQSIINFYLFISFPVHTLINVSSPEYTQSFIPKDLEFFISSGDIKCNSILLEGFRLSFFATSICYVLIELQKYIQNEIYKKEYTSANLPALPEQTSKSGESLPHLSLTPTETRIYNLITEDITIKQLATTLDDKSKKSKTTQRHLKNIAQKLGYENGALTSIKKYKREKNSVL